MSKLVKLDWWTSLTTCTMGVNETNRREIGDQDVRYSTFQKAID